MLLTAALCRASQESGRAMAGSHGRCPCMAPAAGVGQKDCRHTVLHITRHARPASMLEQYFLYQPGAAARGRASTMRGMPSSRESFMRCLKHSIPIRPRPMFSCRSFLLPSGHLHDHMTT